MRFWAPKVQVEESGWSVILNPLRGELDKKRVAEKISELFHLSFEEARELAQNTPIILLDKLTHPAALELQNVFQEIRADVHLTNDSLMKRRCYRAVWPEPPRLSFLESKSTPSVPLVLEPVPPSVSSSPLRDDAGTVSGSLPDWEKKYFELEALHAAEVRENQELRQGLEREIKSHSEKNATELRSTLEEWEERTQGLKEEYREAQAIYEEKILGLQKELENFRTRLGEDETRKEKIRSLEKQNQVISERVNALEGDRETLSRTLKERSDEMGIWREKYQTVAQKLERFESLYEEEQKRREQAETARREAHEMAERTHREIEMRLGEIDRWRREFQELTQFSEQQDAEIKRLRDAHHQLAGQLESAQRQARELLYRVEEQQLIDKRTRLANDLAEKESRLREVMLETERLRQEIRDREMAAQALAGQQSNLEREILETKQAQRYLLEQNKIKDKAGKFKHTARDLGSEEASSSLES